MVRVNPSPLGKLLARHSETALTEALADTRVVLVTGARQCGKSTLLGLVAKGRDAEWRNLDAAVTRQAAAADPDGFVDSAGLMVIDEIQRVPDLLLAIKEQVDADPRPGRYLLSGSARVLALRGLPDTLPGRIETIELWPFSQGEVDGTADRFVDAIRRGGRRGDEPLDQRVMMQEYAIGSCVAGHRVDRAALADLVPGPGDEHASCQALAPVRHQVDSWCATSERRALVERDHGDVGAPKLAFSDSVIATCWR